MILLCDALVELSHSGTITYLLLVCIFSAFHLKPLCWSASRSVHLCCVSLSSN